MLGCSTISPSVLIAPEILNNHRFFEVGDTNHRWFWSFDSVICQDCTRQAEAVRGTVLFGISSQAILKADQLTASQ